VLLLARHGETDWNAAQRWQGHADVPLNARGIKQARELAEALRDIPLDAIYASDLSRAHATAQIVGETKGLPVTTMTALREVDVGSWSGLTNSEIAAKFPGMARHDGETDDALLVRVRTAVLEIGTRHDGSVLLVMHGNAMRAIVEHATGIRPRRIVNCEVLRIRCHQGLLSAIVDVERI
ncbi:MAG: histidine phosphatase family protein, partial [Kofleriaceae bacterium]|nr:histidine phosphatase family protein [Kofleriaceae bacterium]